MLRQRVYGLACGYEDLNDHDTLRNDIAFQTAVEKDQALGSRSTLCRFEQRADRGLMWRMHEELLAQFIAAYETPPKSLILDFDATAKRLLKNIQGRLPLPKVRRAIEPDSADNDSWAVGLVRYGYD